MTIPAKFHIAWTIGLRDLCFETFNFKFRLNLTETSKFQNNKKFCPKVEEYIF